MTGPGPGPGPRADPRPTRPRAGAKFARWAAGGPARFSPGFRGRRGAAGPGVGDLPPSGPAWGARGAELRGGRDAGEVGVGLAGAKELGTRPRRARRDSGEHFRAFCLGKRHCWELNFTFWGWSAKCREDGPGRRPSWGEVGRRGRSGAVARARLAGEAEKLREAERSCWSLAGTGRGGAGAAGPGRGRAGVRSGSSRQRRPAGRQRRLSGTLGGRTAEFRFFTEFPDFPEGLGQREPEAPGGQKAGSISGITGG
jgi:hypothetical protein